jgi:hypothetical protein
MKKWVDTVSKAFAFDFLPAPCPIKTPRFQAEGFLAASVK